VQTWREMMDYVGFSEADAEHLSRLRPHVKPHLKAITDRFYETIDRFPEARDVFEDTAQVNRLKNSLQLWTMELLQGPHDDVYWHRRRRIGRIHVRVGLAQRYMFTAMNLLRSHLTEIAWQALGHDDARLTGEALGRIMDIELGVMCGTYMDAHEARELKTLQQLIIQNMPITVLCLDEAGRVTSATAPHRHLQAANISTEHYSHYLSRELLEAADFSTHIGQALATGKEITIPRVVVGEAGAARYFRLSILPLEHELARVLVHIEELTDVVRAQDRAQQAESLARLGSLAANVAHEIRNPLSAISATLQVIGGSLGVDDRRKRILGKVNEQVLRLDRLVTDLLGYARPAAPKLRPADLSELAREAAAQSDTQPHLVIDNPVTVQVDPQYAQQIMVNLLQNARDASGSDGNVWLCVGPGPRLEVIDDGPGIADEVADRLFEPFVTTKTRGTGLGLAISRKLAESMEGTLKLTPAPRREGHGTGTGTGACFRLSLTPVTGET
jgi:signal transduction histidine kinase/truncated hemoglobin YjbI